MGDATEFVHFAGSLAERGWRESASVLDMVRVRVRARARARARARIRVRARVRVRVRVRARARVKVGDGDAPATWRRVGSASPSCARRLASPVRP